MPIRIAHAILSNGPLTAAGIAKAIRVPRQRVAYHLPTMVDDGILIETLDSYTLQPFIMDDCLFKQLIDEIATSMPMVRDGIEEPTVEKMVSNFTMFLNLINIQLRDE